MKSFFEKFYKQIMEAKQEAFRENIKANMLVINEKSGIAKVTSNIFSHSGSISVLPPMICGLESYISKNELPEDVSFVMLEAPNTERESIFSDGMKSGIKKFAEALKEKLNDKFLEMKDSKETDEVMRASVVGIIAGLLRSIDFVDECLEEFFGDD